MKRETAILAVVAAALALVAGLAVGQVGALGLVVIVGLGLAAAAFVDLRITLLAIIPAMVLLPELPLALPLRTEDLLLAPLAAAWLTRLALGLESLPRTPLNRPLFAIIIVELAAVLWGVYRGTAGVSPVLYSATFFLLKTVEVALMYFIVISAIRSERDLRLFTYVFCAAAAALGIWGMFERGAGTGDAITGPAGHGGYSLLGLTFVVLLAVLAGLFLTQRSRLPRMFLVLAAAPVTYSLLFTFSRQSYVGAAAAIAAIVWVRNRRLIIPALLLALALPVLVPEVVQQRAESIVTNAPDPRTGSHPYATRVNALRERLPEVLLESPLVGFGLAALPPGFLDNQYLLTLYYTGIIGLVVFLWLLWSALRTSYSAYGSLEGESRGLALAWLAATAGLAVAGLAGSPFVAVRVRQVYWFLAALVVAAMHVAAKRRGVEAGVAVEEGSA